MHILVVDDEHLIARAAGRLLSRARIEAAFAETGRAALDHLSAHGEEVALVLLDLHMPDVGGMQFLRIRAANPTLAVIPVIVSSGGADPEELREFDIAGLVEKPFAADEFVDMVRAAARGLSTRR
jgi:CheY-like chemotaxis protein